MSTWELLKFPGVSMVLYIYSHTSKFSLTVFESMVQNPRAVSESLFHLVVSFALVTRHRAYRLS